jgi:transposase InsO family protein
LQPARWLQPIDLHWEIRPKMEKGDIETIIQRTREHHLDVHPRIISDNGPQFIARDFKQFIRICGMTHVRSSAYYPQSNGKIERWHRSIKSECVRPGTPLTVENAVRLIEGYVRHYNEVRLRSAIGYLTPADKLSGRDKEIFTERDRKLDKARTRRKSVRAEQRHAS